MGSESPRKVALSFLEPNLYQDNCRLRNANILLITMRAIANEIAKNLVLSGIGSLTVQDDQSLREEDLGAQFLAADEDVGKNVSSDQN